MAFPEYIGKGLGHGIPHRKRLRRRLEKQPRGGMSLKQWRRVKGKKPVASLGRNQKPLNSLAEAKKEVAAVEKLFRGGGKRLIAFTGLLSRAFAGEQNQAVIAMIERARDKLIKKLRYSKAEAKEVPRHPFALNNRTQLALDTINNHLSKRSPKEAQPAIFALAGLKGPECRVVASVLEQKAEDVVGMIENEPSLAKRKPFVDTLFKLYAAAQSLYENAGNQQQAKLMRDRIRFFVKRYSNVQ